MHESRTASLQQGWVGKAVGRLERPMPSKGRLLSIRARSIQQRFERLDEAIANIDKHIRALANQGAVDPEVLEALRETCVAVSKPHRERPRG